MCLVHLLCQLPLPGAGRQWSGEPPDAHGIAQCEPGQPLVADALQRGAEPLIILLGNPIGVVLLKLGFESAEHLPNRGELFYQPIAMPRGEQRRHGPTLDTGPKDAGPTALGAGDCSVSPALFTGGDPSTGFPDPSAPAAFRTRHEFISFTGRTGPAVGGLLHRIFHCINSCHGENIMLSRPSQLQNHGRHERTGGWRSDAGYAV